MTAKLEALIYFDALRREKFESSSRVRYRSPENWHGPLHYVSGQIDPKSPLGRQIAAGRRQVATPLPYVQWWLSVLS